VKDLHTTTLTDFHAAYYAYELTKRSATGSVERFAHVLADAQVDLNPHQIEAALFAFRTPFSKGAILADEVGLGKTIEAGLLLSQKWAERKRRLLVIVPANLRKQWAQELADKFFLPSVILEAKSFNEAVRAGNLNPFQQDAVILCSYQFAKTKEPYVRQTEWNLVVIDEAHRLRNVYKGTSKIASAIKNAVAPYPKVLLTATPLQNTLLELYGLVSIIDDFTFGDLRSFRARFSRSGSNGSTPDFDELKQRLAPICKRTLRRQVLVYVPYTYRHALVQEFVPSADEQRLYDLVSDYLQTPKLYALPASQRQLMTLLLRKLLSSSTYAISATLGKLADRLEYIEQKSAAADVPSEDIAEDIDTFDELADEWEENEPEAKAEPEQFSPGQIMELRAEKAQIREFETLAGSIIRNSKGEALLAALRRGFAAAAEARKSQGEATLQQKAVVFTESRRTQEYLFNLLQDTEFAGKIVLFNGTNTDAASSEIYKRWAEKHAGTDRVTSSRSADMRAALVDCFRDDASIMIATEAAAEGINLQFCNLVVNYDLPWNPQRIEQRIGRCHRYGQKFDVVVVNFLNKANAADMRVYALLEEKFKLFDGVFGASDEVLGAVESGVDFEKRIAGILQKCRTPEQIAFEFDELQREMEDEIEAGHKVARERLFDNFDQEVIEKVRIQSSDVLGRFQERLWRLSQHILRDVAIFDNEKYCFELTSNPFPKEKIHPGPYKLGQAVDDANTYRPGHPLAARVIESAAKLRPDTAEVTFDYSGSRKNIAILEGLRGQSGYLTCSKLTMSGLDTEDTLMLAGTTDSGEPIDEAQCRRLFDLDGIPGAQCTVPDDAAAQIAATNSFKRQAAMEEASKRSGVWFDEEMEKLDRWAEDRRTSLKAELEELDAALKDAKKAARQAGSLPEKLARQREARSLESKREEAWRTYDKAARDIDSQKDAVLDDIGRRLEQEVAEVGLFSLRWTIA
jgi:superfamily II DNA or RNA helicase